MISLKYFVKRNFWGARYKTCHIWQNNSFLNKASICPRLVLLPRILDFPRLTQNILLIKGMVRTVKPNRSISERHTIYPQIPEKEIRAVEATKILATI